MSIDAITITPNPCNVQQSFVISCEVSPRTPTETVIVPVGYYEKRNSSGNTIYDWQRPGNAYDGKESTYGQMAYNLDGGRDNHIYFRVPISANSDIVAIRAELLLSSASRSVFDLFLTAGTSASNQTRLTANQQIEVPKIAEADRTWFSAEWVVADSKTADDIKANAANLCLEIFPERPKYSGNRRCHEIRLVVEEWK